MRRLALILGAVLALALASSAAGAIAPKTSLPDVESQLMCVTCKIPLNLAESAQADRERALVRRLIAEGKSKQQVLDAMVASYGPRVLSTPSTSGVDLTAWLVPGGIVVLLLGAGVLAAPRWRRRGRAARAAAPAPLGPALAPADARRLDEELRRFDG